MKKLVFILIAFMSIALMAYTPLNKSVDVALNYDYVYETTLSSGERIIAHKTLVSEISEGLWEVTDLATGKVEIGGIDHDWENRQGLDCQCCMCGCGWSFETFGPLPDFSCISCPACAATLKQATTGVWRTCDCGAYSVDGRTNPCFTIWW